MSVIGYLSFRIADLLIGYLPYSVINALAKFLGIALYYTYPKYRKRALSNLALASGLHLSNNEIVRYAKLSLQNTALTFLQYPKLAREKRIEKLVIAENMEPAEARVKQGLGVIFFCGHQANWETLFLEGTRRMPGIAIGRPIKNHLIYSWVVRMRERFGGKIIPPQNALKESLKALKQGKFVGIVGDQGMPDSGFSSSFLGRNAWTSPLPALLAMRTGCPIVVATTRREGRRSIITCSDFIWPDGKTSAEIMTQVLAIFEKSVKERPEDWMWIHNRFKQQLPDRLPKHLRYDSVALIFADDPTPWLPNLRKLYPTEPLTLFIPSGITITHPDIEFIPYSHPRDLHIRDYRFKLVIDFAKKPKARRHFSRLSAQKTLSYPSPQELFNQ